ncbi:MAG: TetR/AcrR family transcriptional regulator [Rickettsiales bacterium]|nr:TetR/AcrR family transcriptional regulator [Rickettsiales bacterium]
MNGEEKQTTRGRPLSFDRAELLEQVMQLFWEHGYGKLSFNEIANATGLTRASLYNTFESKEALFVEAMTHYQNHSPSAILKQVQPGEAVSPAFFQMLDDICTLLASDEKYRGCMAVNCYMELANNSSLAGETIRKLLGEQQQIIRKLITQGIALQELPHTLNIDTAANMLSAFISGLGTFSKGGADEATLQEMCHHFLRNLGFKTLT